MGGSPVATAKDLDEEEDRDPYSGPSREAEMSIVAAMILDNSVIPHARALIKGEHFHSVPNRVVFEAICDMADRGEVVELVGLSAELQRTKKLAFVNNNMGVVGYMEFCSGAVRLPEWAKLVRERWLRRISRELGRKLIEKTQDASIDMKVAISDHRKAVRTVVEEHQGVDRRAWMDDLKTVRQVLDTEYPPLESIVGTGLLTRGSFAIFAGHSNLGKTYLTIQMMAAILGGQPWFGQQTKAVRVGMLEFEMPWVTMQARMRRLGGALEQFAEGADILCQPKGHWYITYPEVRERLIDWCGERQLGLLVIDPLNRVRRGDANDEEIAAEVLDSIHEIRERTGCCIMLVHHVRKVPSGGNGGPRTSSIALDSIKGPSRYCDDADSVFLIDEVIDGGERLIRFDWAKSRFGERPPFLYLKRQATGFFESTESPTQVRESADENLHGLLRAAWTAGIQLADAETVLKAKPDTARRALKRIGAVARGSTRDRRYFHPDCLAELEPELPAGTPGEESGGEPGGSAPVDPANPW
jgi:hypothetical protein